MADGATAPVETTSVRVALRVRPLTIGEVREGAQASVAVQDELNTIVLGSGASERSFRCVGAKRRYHIRLRFIAHRFSHPPFLPLPTSVLIPLSVPVLPTQLFTLPQLHPSCLVSLKGST